jgi:hypothetical protein
MMRPRLCTALLSLSILVAVAAPAWAQEKSTKPQPTPEGYTRHEINGFTVYVHRDVIAENRISTDQRKPLQVLNMELNTVYRQLGEHVVRRLQKNVPVYVEWRKIIKDRRDAVAVYFHKNDEFDRDSRRVTILRMDIITRMRQPNAPFDAQSSRVLLHEMAHAVHFDHRDWDDKIKAAYDQAKERGLYRAKRPSGSEADHYALDSPPEYFAELSCAYLARLHYFPHTRNELLKHDPVGYKLMEDFWFKVQSERNLPAAKVQPGVAKSAVDKVELAAAGKLELIRLRIEAGKLEQAAERLKELIRDYPDTKAAEEAKNLLAKLNKEPEKPDAKK